ncbi:hypothetical protein MBLNU459_g0598t1 [Dothideomycetes sp. NU459]
MGWLSILPEHLSGVERWIARIFLVLGLLVIGPWALLLVYDFLFYVWRTATYEVPVVGGRARGRLRPRAPSLTERPSGHRRTFSLNVPVIREDSGNEGSHDPDDKPEHPNMNRRRRSDMVAVQD